MHEQRKKSEAHQKHANREPNDAPVSSLDGIAEETRLETRMLHPTLAALGADKLHGSDRGSTSRGSFGIFVGPKHLVFMVRKVPGIEKEVPASTRASGAQISVRHSLTIPHIALHAYSAD